MKKLSTQGLYFKIFIIFSSLIISLVTQAGVPEMPYQDDSFGCISQADANRYTSDLKINTASFGGVELCRSEVDTKKLFDDLFLIENGKFQSTGQNNLIRGFVDASQYYSWLKQQTYGVERGQDVPYATAYNSGGYFTMQDGWAKLSTLGRVGTFIHEARHTQGYRHIACQQGPYQGFSNIAGCDSNYSYGGSHAVEMEYYAHVSVQGVNFHPVYKKMARLMAIARSNIFFNTPVLKSRTAVLTLSADRQQAYLFDQGKWLSRETPEHNTGRLKRTSFGAVLYEGLRALSIDMYQNSGFADDVEDTYSYFKLLAEASPQIKDLEEFDSGTKRFVVQVTQDDQLKAFDFPNGVWGNAQKIPFHVQATTTAIPGSSQSGYYLISDQGQIYKYQPETQRLVSQSGRWDFSNQEVIVYNSQNLILRNDGKIYIQNQGTLQPWSEAQAGIFSGLTSVPLYDAFEVIKE